jgi:beta-lactamase regulating signal transducer with metallopeptidase domain
MIASFMLYASIVTACLAFAALAIESLLRQFGRPVRWVWAGALLTTVLLLGLAPLRRDTSAGTLVPTPSSMSLTSLPIVIAPSPSSVPRTASNLLLIVWVGATTALVLLVAAVQLRYRRLSGRWPATNVAGTRVRLSPTLGPAVMGLWRPEIVVPHWLLARGAAEQQIVVAHEREHLGARDPLLLESALLVVLLMPWNVAVWWMFSRLRLAVELDCDARVLRAGTTPHVYGNLLIDVAALHAGHRAPAIALLDPPSNLQRRLNAMRPQSIRFSSLRLTAAGIVALGALIVACQAELPTDRQVTQMDAASMQRMATKHLGDSIQFKVDGQVVDGRVAQMIAPGEIASVVVDHADSGASWINVTTMHAGQPRTNRVAYKTQELATFAPDEHERVASENGFTGAAFRVMQDAHEAIGMKLGMHGAVEQKQEFHGLIFINGKRADASEFQKLVPADLKSVEVIKGPSAQKQFSDPAAAFGVIKIITK